MSTGGESVKEFLSSVLPVPGNSRVEDERFQRPLVTLTFAQSLDGKIAGKGGKQLILSGRESMLMTHWMRTKHDAILVGIGTALNDDPQLNSRHIPEHERPSHLPRPVILDASLRLRSDCKLLRNYQEGKGRRPWVICDANLNPDYAGRKSTLENAGARVIGVKRTSLGFIVIPDLLKALYTYGVKTLMVEGGAAVIGSFLAESARAKPSTIIDTLIITIAPTLVGDEGVGYGKGLSTEQTHSLKHIRTKIMGQDVVIVGAL
ncbi:bacterial bifunctional deaminase-reductase [Rhizopogon vinicolor AM-OR11-026]|uniref:2,5-diamino-6-ribosylamino-4(3H)-pyrimidinone 5'-phosphate reductase n=1 Tax=Rhizopogon vinicolor AM-OR11-026 TaxID=1314800 RepID=A0A1B7N7P0_9AGAM|nr:bacterial bifunctional deaminase-reductase [Rhizopogon vinicolor AM-OR11-026]